MKFKDLSPEQQAYYTGWYASTYDSSSSPYQFTSSVAETESYFFCRGVHDRFNNKLLDEGSIIKLVDKAKNNFRIDETKSELTTVYTLENAVSCVNKVVAFKDPETGDMYEKNLQELRQHVPHLVQGLALKFPLSSF